MANVRAVGAAGLGLGSSNAGFAGWLLHVRVGIRCSSCCLCSMGDLVARGVRGRALYLLRLPSSRGPLSMCRRRGCAGVWAQHCPLGLLTLWGLCAAGVAGGLPGGVACHRCEGRLVSGAVPPPAARPPGRAAGVPRPVCPGCGWRGCWDPAPAPQRPCGPALRAVGVAGGRPRGGCLPLS